VQNTYNTGLYQRLHRKLKLLLCSCVQNTYNTGLYQRLHRKLAESVGGTANGHAQQGGAPLPDIAVGAADHGLAAMGAGGIPALDLNWVDTRYF
jgi:hypothetical protein